MSETLVLNKNYQAIDRIPWQDAFTAVWSGRAEIIDSYPDRVVRSPSTEFKMPCIIRFLGKVFYFKKGVRFSRAAIFKRDNQKCQYCAKALSASTFTLDHIIPRSRIKAPESATTWWNIVVACKGCNSDKGGRTPEEAGLKLLKLPDCPKTNHFMIWDNSMPFSWKQYLP